MQSKSAQQWQERYLGAVSRYLPTAQQDDICDELADLIDDKYSAIQQQEGAAADISEEQRMLTILENLGPPMRLASGYWPQQQIEQVAVPIYWLTLRFSLWAVLIVCACLYAVKYFVAGGG